VREEEDIGCGHEHEAHEHELRPAGVVERAAAMASAMGDIRRLRLLELLFDGRHCVSELAEETGDSMSAISQRLKILHGARLVSRERDGKHVYYSLSDDHVRTIMGQLFLHSEE
jgi:ArsR family transcriptional regulator, lead/cadmium/zinc/bismuth-responsive transcriptional repressor